MDTLRWTGQSEGGRGALAAAVRRKAAAAAEEEAKEVAAASHAEGSHVRPDATATSRPPPKELTAPIGYENVARSEKALRYEEALRVRTQLEQQKRRRLRPSSGITRRRASRRAAGSSSGSA